MSESDVHEIICPVIEHERDDLRRWRKLAEDHILWLRRRLLYSCPELPTDEYDGNAWAAVQDSEQS